MKTVLVVSDVLLGAQINGVGTWLVNTKKELEGLGYGVTILDARAFSYTMPLPSYPEIRLALTRRKKMIEILRKIDPDHVHIITEGSLGLLARAACKKLGWNYSTAYHTRFPEYVYTRTKISFLQELTYKYIRWFHCGAHTTIVTTDSLKSELEQKGFRNLSVVPLGVDIELFKKNHKSKALAHIKAPVFVYFGRLAVEKNVTDFLRCKLPGVKLVIGDGPARKMLEETYRDDAIFVGYKQGQELVDLLSASSVCICPSRTETFGLTIIEALACELPVAAYDVQGPNDIISNGVDGHLGADLEDAAIKCLSIKRENCRRRAESYSWRRSTQLLASALRAR